MSLPPTFLSNVLDLLAATINIPGRESNMSDACVHNYILLFFLHLPTTTPYQHDRPLLSHT